VVKLFAKFIEAIHGAEVVSLTVMSADDGSFLGYVDSADRITMGFYSGIANPGRF
jgi:hypothetical protein